MSKIINQIGGFLKMKLFGQSSGVDVPLAADSDGHLQLDIASATVTATVDQVTMRGNDGEVDRKVHLDSSGDIQVDLLSSPTLNLNAHEAKLIGLSGSDQKQIAVDSDGHQQVDILTTPVGEVKLMGLTSGSQQKQLLVADDGTLQTSGGNSDTYKTIIGDSGSTVASGADTLDIEGGTAITTAATEDKITINADVGEAGDIAEINPDDAAAAGASGKLADAAHQHAFPCGTPGNITPDATASEGTANSAARSDHVHGITCGTPSTIGTANQEGTGSGFARNDHVHAINNHASRHTDGTDDVQDATAAQKGLATAAQITKLDGIEAGADVTDAANVDSAGAVMEADFNAKGDLLTATANDTPAILSVGTDGHVLKANSGATDGIEWSASATPSAHKDSHDPNDGSDPLDCAAAGNITPDDSATEGTAHSFARSDHTHGITCAAPGNISQGDTAAEGTANSFARSDHVHGFVLSRSTCFVVCQSDEDVEVADGKNGFVVGADMNGFNLTAVTASLHTPGATSGTTDIQVRRRRENVEVDMLSTKVTIDTTVYTASDGVVDTDKDDLATGDLLYVDVDAITGTAGKGLSVKVTFQKPTS